MKKVVTRITQMTHHMKHGTNMMQMVIKKYIKKHPMAQNIGKNTMQKEIRFMKRIPMAKIFGTNTMQKEI